MEKLGTLILIAVICTLTIVLSMFGGCLQPRENFFDEEIEASLGGAAEEHESGAQEPHPEAPGAKPEAPGAKPEAHHEAATPASGKMEQPVKEATVTSAKVVRGPGAAAARKPPVLSRKKPPEPAPAPAPEPAVIEGFSGEMYAAV